MCHVSSIIFQAKPLISCHWSEIQYTVVKRICPPCKDADTTFVDSGDTLRIYHPKADTRELTLVILITQL